MKKGTWSFALLFLLLIAFAYFSGMNPVKLITGLAGFYTAFDLTTITLSFTQTITLILQLTLMVAMVSFAVSLICQKAKTVKEKDINIFQYGPIGAYILIALEELFRALFIFTIPSLFGGGFTVTIISMTIGNLIWTLVHVYNYNGPLLDRIIHITPIFVMGFVFGPVMIRYGFLVSLLVHYTYDALVWSMQKVRDTKAANIIIFVYWLLVALALVFVFNGSRISFSMLLPFFNSLIMPAGGNPWVMIALMVGGYTLSGILMSALDFDFIGSFEGARKSLNDAGQEGIKPGILFILIAYLAGMAILILMISGVAWILMHFVENPLAIAIITASIVALLDQPKSGSAMSSLWFADVPMTFLMVFIVLTYGFGPSLMILSVAGLTTFIPSIVRMVSNA